MINQRSYKVPFNRRYLLMHDSFATENLLKTTTNRMQKYRFPKYAYLEKYRKQDPPQSPHTRT